MGQSQEELNTTMQITKVSPSSRAQAVNILPFIDTVVMINEKMIIDSDQVKTEFMKWKDSTITLDVLNIFNEKVRKITLEKCRENEVLGISVKLNKNQPFCMNLCVIEKDENSPAKDLIENEDHLIGIEGVYIGNEDNFFCKLYELRGKQVNFYVFNKITNTVRSVVIKLNEDPEMLLGCEFGMGMLFDIANENIKVLFDKEKFNQLREERLREISQEELVENERGVAEAESQKSEGKPVENQLDEQSAQKSLENQERKQEENAQNEESKPKQTSIPNSSSDSESQPGKNEAVENYLGKDLVKKIEKLQILKEKKEKRLIEREEQKKHIEKEGMVFNDEDLLIFRMQEQNDKMDDFEIEDMQNEVYRELENYEKEVALKKGQDLEKLKKIETGQEGFDRMDYLADKRLQKLEENAAMKVDLYKIGQKNKEGRVYSKEKDLTDEQKEQDRLKRELLHYDEATDLEQQRLNDEKRNEEKKRAERELQQKIAEDERKIKELHAQEIRLEAARQQKIKKDIRQEEAILRKEEQRKRQEEKRQQEEERLKKEEELKKQEESKQREEEMRQAQLIEEEQNAKLPEHPEELNRADSTPQDQQEQALSDNKQDDPGKIPFFYDPNFEDQEIELEPYHVEDVQENEQNHEEENEESEFMKEVKSQSQSVHSLFEDKKPENSNLINQSEQNKLKDALDTGTDDFDFHNLEEAQEYMNLGSQSEPNTKTPKIATEKSVSDPHSFDDCSDTVYDDGNSLIYKDESGHDLVLDKEYDEKQNPQDKNRND